MDRKKRKTIILVLLLAVLLLMSGGILLFTSQSYTISFDSAGGEMLSNVKVNPRKSKSLPVPIYPGRTFLGWTTTSDSEDYIEDTGRLSGSTTLYAQWTDTNYVISFYSEGESIGNLAYGKDDVFDTFEFNTNRSQIWQAKDDSHPAHETFLGWRFSDLLGRETKLLYKGGGSWKLQPYGVSEADAETISTSNPFKPTLYDSVLHAMWSYKKAEIWFMNSKTGFEGNTTGTYSFRYGETQATEMAYLDNPGNTTDRIGWKLGFTSSIAGVSNKSPLSVASATDIMQDNRADSVKLSAASLQKVNAIYDTVYQDMDKFYLDPMFAYLAYQSSSSAGHKLYFYPVEFAEGQGLYFDDRLNAVTQTSETVSIVNGGSDICLGMPADRMQENFVEYWYKAYTYDASGEIVSSEVKRVTKNQILSGNNIVPTSSLHRTNATIFHETWDKKTIDVRFNYGSGARKIKDINLPQETKSKYAELLNVNPVVSVSKKVGESFILPSAAMYAMANMVFIGWQEQVKPGEKPGRIYPAGSEYTVSEEFATTYTMNAIWSDAQVNFSFDLNGGRGFTTSEISNMRGQPGTQVYIPSEEPTRHGYEFDGWVNNKTGALLGAGASITVLSEKQILTAKWTPKQVSVNLNFSYKSGNEAQYTVEGSITASGAFDSTIRLKGIDEASINSGFKVTDANGNSANIAAGINSKKDVVDTFAGLYTLVGWKFTSGIGGVTYNATQAVSLDARIVTENGDLLEANASVETQAITKSLVVFSDFSIDVKTEQYAYNSVPTLGYSNFYNYVPEAKKKTHNFIGFFALTKSVVDGLVQSGMDISGYLDADTGTYKTVGANGVSYLFTQNESGVIGHGSLAVLGAMQDDIYLYMMLEPKKILIEYFGDVNASGASTKVVRSIPDSYFGDERAASRINNNIQDINAIINNGDFKFIDWTVEYYTAENSSVPFYTERVNPNVDELVLNLTDASGNPVENIKVKPNVQSKFDYLVRIVDAAGKVGAIDKVYDMNFVGAIQYSEGAIVEGSYVSDGNYTGSTVQLSKTALPENLKEAMSVLSLEVDYFTTGPNGTGAKFFVGEIVGLRAGITTGGTMSGAGARYFASDDGRITLYPVFKAIKYSIAILNEYAEGDKVVWSSLEATPNEYYEKDGRSIALGVTASVVVVDNSNVSRAGYCFDTRGPGYNNLTLYSDAVGGGAVSYRIGDTYTIGSRTDGTQINFAGFAQYVEGVGENVIVLYIKWIPCNVSIEYYDTNFTTTPTVGVYGGNATLKSNVGWVRNGYKAVTKWSTSPGGAGVVYNAGDRVALGDADVASVSLNAVAGTKSTVNFPHVLTLRLYPVWEATKASHVNFILNSVAGANPDCVGGIMKDRFDADANKLVATYTDQLFDSYMMVDTQWDNFLYDKTLSVNDQQWIFDGWYYNPDGSAPYVQGVSRDLSINQYNQLKFDDTFLDGVAIRSTINIYAKWVRGTFELFSFDIKKEAVEQRYIVTDIVENTSVNGAGEVLAKRLVEVSYFVTAITGSVTIDNPDGTTQDVELVAGDEVAVRTPDNKIVKISLEDYETEISVGMTVKRWELNPQADKVSVRLNASYEYVGTRIADGQTLVEVGDTLVRWETREITGKSLMYNYSAQELVDFVASFTTETHKNYATVGFEIANIYNRFITGTASGESVAANSRFKRRGYELVGFAISDERDSGIRYGGSGYADTYRNTWLTAPKPSKISLVPIYKARTVQVVLNSMATDLGLSAGQIIGDSNPITTSFESRISLPLLSTRGATAYIDNVNYMDGWEYNLDGNAKIIPVSDFTNYAVNWDSLVFPSDGAPVVVNMQASWRAAQLAEIRFWAVFAGEGAVGTSVPVGINFKSNLSYPGYDSQLSPELVPGTSAGKVLHGKKPIYTNGVNTGRADYTIPAVNPADISSSFDISSGEIVGMRVKGWYRENGNSGLPNMANACAERVVAMNAVTGGATDIINVYLVYEWIDGVVYFNETSATSYTGLASVAAQYSKPVALPGEDVTKLSGKNLKGWSKVQNYNDVGLEVLKRVNGGRELSVTVDTESDVADIVDSSLNEDDYIRILNDGIQGKQNAIYVWDGGEFTYNSYLTQLYNDSYTDAMWVFNNFRALRKSVKTASGLLSISTSDYAVGDYVRVANDATYGANAIYVWDGSNFVYDAQLSNPRYADYYIYLGEQAYLYDSKQSSSDLIVDGGSVTLYAIWEDLVVTISFFDGMTPLTGTMYGVNFNNGPAYSTKYYYNKVFGVGSCSPLPTPVKPGYAFDGWYTNSLLTSGTKVENGSTMPFKLDAKAKLYAKFIINKYTFAFNTNGGDRTWAPSESRNAQAYNAQTAWNIPMYNEGDPETHAGADFVWGGEENKKFIGWALIPDGATFVLDTRKTDINVFFLTDNYVDGNYCTIKADIMAALSGSVDYTFNSVTNTYTITLYAVWSSGEIDIEYYVDEDAVDPITVQKGYLFVGSDRTEHTDDGALIGPGEADYMKYGVMVADDSVLTAEALADVTVPANSTFGGWRVFEGPASIVDTVLYPGQFLPAGLRDGLQLVPEWVTYTTFGEAVNGVVTYSAQSDEEVVVVPAGFDFNTKKLVVIGGAVLVLPRGEYTVPSGAIEAHDVTRIVLPAVGEIYVEAQAFHAKSVQSMYISDNLNGTECVGNIIAGKAYVDDASGVAHVEGSMKAYLVAQGAQTFDEETAEISFAGQSGKYAYLTDENERVYWGALYNFERTRLLAYPSDLSSTTVLTSVEVIESYAFAYMSNSSLNTIRATSPSLKTVKANAIFHSTASVIRFPGSGISSASDLSASAVSGYNPKLEKVYFDAVDNVMVYAGIAQFNDTNKILYHGADETEIMYVTQGAASVAIGGSLVIGAEVTFISDYALSSCYVSKDDPLKKITSLTVNAVGLDLENSMFMGGHTAHLETMIVDGITSFEGSILANNTNIMSLTLNKNDIVLVKTGVDGNSTFPIFVNSLDFYVNDNDWQQYWNRNAQDNDRIQLYTKSIVYSANGGSGEMSAQESVSYGGELSIPNCTYVAPSDDKIFVGWKTSINGVELVYQPGDWVVGMFAGAEVADVTVVGGGIYIQDSITFEAVWAERMIQFVGMNGEQLGAVAQVQDGANTRAATNLEIAGLKVSGDVPEANRGALVDDSSIVYVLPGYNGTFNGQLGDDSVSEAYGFVGWIKGGSVSSWNSLPAANSGLWKWTAVENINDRIIPDGVSANTVINVSGLAQKFYALYDLVSENITYSYVSTTAVSARATSKAVSGNIAIPAAVYNDEDGSSTRGFMRKVTMVEPNGFSYMTATRIYVGGCVEVIGERAFEFIDAATSIKFGHSYWGGSLDASEAAAHYSPYLVIGNYAFANCRQVTSVNIPLGTVEIGAKAFLECFALGQVQMDVMNGGLLEDARLTKIGASAFEACKSLTGTFYIPAKVTSIGTHAFTMTAIASFASASSVYKVTSNNYGLYYDGGTAKTLVIFAPGAPVTTIDLNALTSVITHIADYAIAFNNTIVAADIPAGVTLGRGVFTFCSNLENLKINVSSPSALQLVMNDSGDSAFADINPKCAIKVPSASLDTWVQNPVYASEKNLFVGY